MYGFTTRDQLELVLEISREVSEIKHKNGIDQGTRLPRVELYFKPLAKEIFQTFWDQQLDVNDPDSIYYQNRQMILDTIWADDIAIYDMSHYRLTEYGVSVEPYVFMTKFREVFGTRADDILDEIEAGNHTILPTGIHVAGELITPDMYSLKVLTANSKTKLLGTVSYTTLIVLTHVDTDTPTD